MRTIKRLKFERLKQIDDMTVEDFYLRFMTLARYVAELVPDEPS